MDNRNILKWNKIGSKTSKDRFTKARQQAEHGLAMALMRGDDRECVAHCMERIDDTYIDKTAEGAE